MATYTGKKKVVTGDPWFKIRSRIFSVVKQANYVWPELISNLLEFVCNIQWRTGRSLKCHARRYILLGRLVARSC